MLNNIAAIFSGGVSGGAGAFESIATATGTGSSNTITFSSIPSTYQHMQIRAIGRSDRAALTETIYLTINGDTGANHAAHALEGEGASAFALGYSSQNNIQFVKFPGASNASDIMGSFVCDIQDYASTTKNKTIRTFNGYDANGSGRIRISSGLWMNTNAITSVSIIITAAGNFTTSSTFALYGIKGA